MKTKSVLRRIERTAPPPSPLTAGKGRRTGHWLDMSPFAPSILDTTRASLHCIMGYWYGRGRHIYIVLYKLFGSERTTWRRCTLKVVIGKSEIGFLSSTSVPLSRYDPA